jgi:hypothetical protein
MAELSSKSPRENYATRQAETRPNIGHPGVTAERTQDQTRAATEIAQRQQATTVTAVDATVLRAAVAAALTGAGAAAPELAAAATALSDANVLAGITPTVTVSTTLTAAR